MDEKKSRVVSPAFFILNHLNINVMSFTPGSLGVTLETLTASRQAISWEPKRRSRWWKNVPEMIRNRRDAYASRLNAMRYAPNGRGVTLETLTDGQMSGKSGTKTENGHISTATAEVEPLEAWTPGPNW